MGLETYTTDGLKREENMSMDASCLRRGENERREKRELEYATDFKTKTTIGPKVLQTKESQMSTNEDRDTQKKSGSQIKQIACQHPGLRPPGSLAVRLVVG